ncbi:MAG: hypothetical protein ACI8PZ_005435, partial [Myxococcota bacterium]
DRREHSGARQGRMSHVAGCGGTEVVQHGIPAQ